MKPLTERWRSLYRQGLDLKHQTGQFLNDKLGSPEQRQQRGKGVLKQVAKELGVAVSELSRMRAFAHAYKSVKDFNLAHAGVMTWSAVKKAIPRYKPQRSVPKVHPPSTVPYAPKSRKPIAPRVEALKRSLNDLASRLGKVSDLPDHKKQELTEAIQAFAGAIPGCLGVRLTVEKVKDQAQEVTPAPVVKAPAVEATLQSEAPEDVAA